MLYAILICSDEECDVAYEAWCEAEELDDLVCELCGCSLQAVAFAEPGQDAPPRRHVQLRDAA